MNTATDTKPSVSKPVSKVARGGDKWMGKVKKAHNVITIDADRCAILGVDILSPIGLPEDCWLLCDVESNSTEPSAELVKSIEATREIDQMIKVVPIPVTPEIAHLEFKDDAGVPQGFVFVIVWGRHRVRAIRKVEGDTPIMFQVKIAGPRETFQELATQALVENAVRRTLSPIREAMQLGKLRDGGLNAAEIARRIGLELDDSEQVTGATIRNKLALLNLGQSIMDMVDSGEIGVTQAYVIGKAPAAHHARLAADALAGHTVAQLQRTARELIERDERVPESTPAANAAPETSSDDQGEDSNGDDSSDESDAGTPPAATGTAPTRTKRPKLADVAEMADRLAGLDNDVARAALAALRFVQGEQTDEQLIMEISKLMGHPFPPKPE